MPQDSQCPECGAALQGGETCEALFHQMLYWENEQPELGSVHHLMVLCYHLQHPSLLSQAGLDTGVQLLRDFLENGLTPEQARREKRQEVDSRPARLEAAAPTRVARRLPAPATMAHDRRGCRAGGEYRVHPPGAHLGEISPAGCTLDGEFDLIPR